ncbi:MAG: hypothetical protein H6698_08460 [Myxococcales bacterium]|nr:hypothetical protein [Myxococcales bacterium]MCB9530866.1 hypothetical protein [Myxococcales bacterium]MCB9532496.1 hypothetical protein [Myxococcales bacterium]MCB9534322.1 hypothetical protein [Myxococcales bacterium]
MAGRKIEDEATARRCLAQAAASGLPKAAWAAQGGWDARSLHLWSVNLSRKRDTGASSPPRRFVEVVSDSRSAATDPAYRVHVGRWVLEVGDDFRPETLKALVAALSQC